MSNPSGPDHDAESSSSPDAPAVERPVDPETEIIAAQDTGAEGIPLPTVTPGERRFTAPSGMDADSTQIIDRPPDEPATEIMGVVGERPKVATPQSIPPRISTPKLPTRNRSWGWVLALILVIAALVAIAVLGTVLLTRNSSPQISQEDRVRETIRSFDTAIQNGDLATLRSITCGDTADGYTNYDNKKWSDIHARVAAARQYPVVASIDQVIINSDHAEANVTSFMASDPSTRSTRSFDLQYRDDQWKICQE